MRKYLAASTAATSVASLAGAAVLLIGSACVTCAVANTTVTYCGPSAGMGCEAANSQMIFLQKQMDVTSGFGNIGSQTGLPLLTITSLGGTALNMFIDLANGFATIDPTQPATEFAGLTFSLPSGFAFQNFIWDAQLVGTTFVTSCTASGTCLPTNTFTNGANQDAEYSINAASGQFFNTVTIDASGSGGFEEVKHLEITLCTIGASGCTTQIPVPEPTSLALLGAGLIGLGAWKFRRPLRNDEA